MGKIIHFRNLTYLWSQNQCSCDLNNKLVLNIVIRHIKNNQDIFDAILEQNFSNSSNYKTLEI